MIIDIISLSITTKVWGWAQIETLGSAVGLATICAKGPSDFGYYLNCVKSFFDH